MKRSRFTEEQIIGFIKQAEAGMPVKELCRKGGFSEADERLDAQGAVLQPLDADALRAALQPVFDAGVRACAIVLLHGWRNPAHELAAAEVARARLSRKSHASRVQPGVASRG